MPRLSVSHQQDPQQGQGRDSLQRRWRRGNQSLHRRGRPWDSWRREEEKRYFTKHTDELQRVLAERQEDGEEGSDEEESGPSEFGNLSKKMKTVTEDGGVLKRILREGFQTGG